MDSFTDKIAQKFTAQDMIKANAAAEEKELERLRMQVAEYDLRVQEIRKLNLKNLELADHLQALIDAENARIREYEDARGAAPGAGVSSDAQQMPGGGISAEQLEDISQKLATQTKQVTLAKLETMERLDALENRLNTRPVLEGIAAKLETQSLSEELLEKFDCRARLDEIEVRLRQQPTADDIAAKLDYRAALEEMALKLESRPTLDEIAERLAGGGQPEGIEEKLNSVKEELADHVHKEDVKVYRNVQAAVSDENKKLAEAASAAQEELKERLAKTEKKVSGLKALAILTLIAALANLGIWAAWMFDVLPKF